MVFNVGGERGFEMKTAKAECRYSINCEGCTCHISTPCAHCKETHDEKFERDQDEYLDQREAERIERNLRESEGA